MKVGTSDDLAMRRGTLMREKITKELDRTAAIVLGVCAAIFLLIVAVNDRRTAPFTLDTGNYAAVTDSGVRCISHWSQPDNVIAVLRTGRRGKVIAAKTSSSGYEWSRLKLDPVEGAEGNGRACWVDARYLERIRQ
jgi:hypothetical protein